MKKTVVITEYTDWKDIDGLIDSFENALKEFGIKLIDNPDTEGTDCFSFILLKEKFNKKELENKISSLIEPFNDDDDDDDDDDDVLGKNDYKESLLEKIYKDLEN